MDQNDNQQTDNSQVNGGFSPPAGFPPVSPPATPGFDATDGSNPITATPIVDDSDNSSTQNVQNDPNDDPYAALKTDSPTINDTPDNSDASDKDDLLSIKQDALAKLSPLVEHLDQTPEEKFRTTLMMIQATDDKSKIKDAYAAAQEITDKKTQAQAFLDIVNEINYFTQQKSS